ncbi:hypothetical protein CXQ85_002179 [Candidozyma haemuli]|uniref:Uncharacterized protein n=1 Tax=Candidozyma haemuli TaxID=45357 RepID=A0A2V1ATY4_9ASCO|nr:hypothetical protein CXQ85_002179 [[Candida] haemuloni]PVH20391.1 hypothetical protein CXQ85_002179 [[Candida] haemuloni]
MTHIESLKDIVVKHDIKHRTLAVYGLDDLVKQADHYTVPSEIREEDVGPMPDILFEDNDPSFCSVFSDQINHSMQTQATQEPSFNAKLLSEGAILSSEFEQELPEAILTSDQIRE